MKNDPDIASSAPHGNDNPQGPVAIFVASLIMGVRFFSILPLDRFIGSAFPHRVPSLNKIAPTLPLASALIALPSLLTLFAISLAQVPFGLAVCLAVLVHVIVTGAMSEDAFADMADGFGAYEKERIIEIMRDPRHGTYGVVAVVLLLLIRTMGFWSMADISMWRALVAILAIQILSRQLSLLVPLLLEPASQTGAGQSAGILAKKPFYFGLGGAVALCLLTNIGIGGFAAVLGGTSIAGLIVWKYARIQQARLGGFTGDLIGGAQALAEIALIVTFVLFF